MSKILHDQVGNYSKAVLNKQIMSKEDDFFISDVIQGLMSMGG